MPLLLLVAIVAEEARLEMILSYELYLLIVGGGLCVFAWWGSARCKFCRKFRLDGHTKECPRYHAPKETAELLNMTKLNDEQGPQTFEEYWKTCPDLGSYESGYRAAWHARDAEIADLKRQLEHSENLYKRTLNDAMAVLNEKADLERQLAARDAVANVAQPVVYFAGVKDGAEIALRDAAIIASQINHEAASAIADMSSDSCVELQKKSAKLVPFVQALDAYVQEKVREEAKKWVAALSGWPSARSDTRTLLVAKLVDRAVLAESEWCWNFIYGIASSADQEVVRERIAANRAKVGEGK